MSLIEAFKKGEVFLKNVRAASEDEKVFHVWWLGQSGFLLKWKKYYLLFDPYLSDSLTEKYANTDKPHVRMSERVVEPASLDFIDVVTSSHNHTDHLDAETLIPLIGMNPDIQCIVPGANRHFVAERLACDPARLTGLVQGETLQAGPFQFHGIPAAHNEIDKDDEGRCRYMGYVVKFGSWSVYHSGDTLKYEGMEEILAPFKVDIAFLPINGNKPERRVAGNMNIQESVSLAKAIGAGVVVPHHYHMFTFNTEDPEKFQEACEQAGQDYIVLRHGEGRIFGDTTNIR